MSSRSPAFFGVVLLVSDDRVAIEQLSESMRRFALIPEQCPDAFSALARLKRSKFEAVVVDFRLGSQVEDVIEGVRQSDSNNHAVVFTVSDNEVEAAEAFEFGSTFVLRRPLSAASIDLTLKAAYGLIVRERRRYFRCPITFPVAIARGAMQTIQSQTVNISEGGMSVIAAAQVGQSEQIKLQFVLPGDEFEFELGAMVRWADELRLGLQFLSSRQTPKLQEWLSSRLEESIPKSVKDKFLNISTG
jgi:ActR/RegA family two-component response regulator